MRQVWIIRVLTEENGYRPVKRSDAYSPYVFRSRGDAWRCAKKIYPDQMLFNEPDGIAFSEISTELAAYASQVTNPNIRNTIMNLLLDDPEDGDGEDAFYAMRWQQLANDLPSVFSTP